MDMFEFVSAARGYHMYKDIWEPSVGEKLIALRDSSNHFHKLAVKVLNGEEIVGHLPCKYASIAGNFLAHGGSITLKVTGHRQHCKQLCGGNGNSMLCNVLLFKKATINRLKDLLMKKV